MPLLSELAERDATGEAAAIYAEIRHLGGVPMVALIFRHFATLPGALEWMWSAVGPAWRSGALQQAAWRVAREAPLQPLLPVSRPALRALDVDEAGEREIAIVLEAYNRANPENMLTMLCVSRLLRGHVATAVPSSDSWSPPAAPAPLVAMGDVTRLPRELSDLLDLVSAPGEPGTPRVVQSLYRHFLHRPAFLALAITLLRQRFDDGSIDGEVAQMNARMSEQAERLVASMDAPPAPHPGIAPVSARFSGRVIPQMIVVGRLLEECMP